MTNLAALTTNYRDIGDTTLDVYRAEFTRVGSPMLGTVTATYAAARPHSALFLAQAWLENQYETTGHIIGPEDHNPVSLRPERDGDTGSHGAYVITASDGGQFLAFRSDADCVREWKRRLFEDPSYKGGVYARTRTLAEMLDVYAPSGDVHPVTGVDNADAGYLTSVVTMLRRFAALEGTTPTEDTGMTDIAPVLPLDYLENADPGTLVVRDGQNVFFRVDAMVRAIRQTPRFQYAGAGSPTRGNDLQAGDETHIPWAWIDAQGDLWLYSDWATRFRGKDFVRVDGSPLTPPDTDPGNVPTTPKPTSPPSSPGTITAENYRQVADPVTLLPEIVWRGTSNMFPGRQGLGMPQAIGYHITDDMNASNVIGWFQSLDSQASSTFVIDRDGTPYQMVSSKDGPWTNGDVNNPRRDIPWLLDAFASGYNFNDYTITYEFVGTPSNPPTEAQYQTAIKLSRYFCHPKVYGINPNRSHQLRHADINSVSRAYCPGPRFDLERIIRELGGDPAKLA